MSVNYSIATLTITHGPHSLSHVENAGVGVTLYGLTHQESYGMVAGQQYALVSYVCTPDVTGGHPGDGIDNDCDHFVDEELPNGIDDDGDGLVDEDLADGGSSVRDYGASVDPDSARTSASTSIPFPLSTTISPSAVAEWSSTIAMEATSLSDVGYITAETTETYWSFDVSPFTALETSIPVSGKTIASSPLPETATHDLSAAVSTVAASESTVGTPLVFSASRLLANTGQTISTESRYASPAYTTPVLQSTPLVTSDPVSPGTTSLDSEVFLTNNADISSSTPVMDSYVSSGMSGKEVSYVRPTDISSSIVSSPTFSASSSVTTIVAATRAVQTTNKGTTPTESNVVPTETLRRETTGDTRAKTTTAYGEKSETTTEVERAVETTTETEETTTKVTKVATNGETTTGPTTTLAETTTERTKTTPLVTSAAASTATETTTDQAQVDETITAAAVAVATAITTSLTKTLADVTITETTTKSTPVTETNNEQSPGEPTETMSTGEQSAQLTTIAAGTTTTAEETTFLETTTDLTFTTETIEQHTPPIEPNVGSVDVVFIVIPFIICVVFPAICLLVLGIKGVVKGRRKKRTGPAPQPKPEKPPVPNRAPITNFRRNTTFISDEVVHLQKSKNALPNLSNFRRPQHL